MSPERSALNLQVSADGRDHQVAAGLDNNTLASKNRGVGLMMIFTPDGFAT